MNISVAVICQYVNPIIPATAYDVSMQIQGVYTSDLDDPSSAGYRAKKQAVESEVKYPSPPSTHAHTHAHTHTHARTHTHTHTHTHTQKQQQPHTFHTVRSTNKRD